MVPAFALDARFGFSSAAEYERFRPDPKIDHLSIDHRPGRDGEHLPAANSGFDCRRRCGSRRGWRGSDCHRLAGEPARWMGSSALHSTGSRSLGARRVRSATGSGGIFCHAMEAQNNQTGCLRLLLVCAGNQPAAAKFRLRDRCGTAVHRGHFWQPRVMDRYRSIPTKPYSKRVRATMRWVHTDFYSTRTSGGICKFVFASSCPRVSRRWSYRSRSTEEL